VPVDDVIERVRQELTELEASLVAQAN